jgi:hypothetical protein
VGNVAQSSETEIVERIQVGRWPFWAGVLLLVATIVLDMVYGPQTNPPYGTGWDFIPLLVIVALILLLGSAGLGSGLGPAARADQADSPAGTR